MRALAAAVTATALLLVMVAGAVPGAAHVGGRPPAFTLSTVPGGPTTGRFRLADHLGRRPIVVLFWATWCAPCRQEMPLYERLWQQHRAAGLVVVAISADNASTIAQSGPAARRLGVHFPVLADPSTRVIAQMNPRRACPFSVWINRAGRIVREHEGFTMAERDSIARGVAALVAAR
jgi:peroxiredoxin